jgi:hypothetical protein
MRKLQLAAKEKLGLQLKIGMSTFPDEAVTFESMLANAETAMMNTKLALNVCIEKATPEATNSISFDPAPTQVK